MKCKMCGAPMREKNTAWDKNGKVTEITWACTKCGKYSFRGYPKE